MFRKQLSPTAAALALLAILAVVQVIYWRLLVYRSPGPPTPPGGGGGGPEALQAVLGRADAVVETLTGEEPGFQDGPAWQARFNGPNALDLAPDGRLLVADSRNHRIRSISPIGRVSTLAGGGEPERRGGMSDGAALDARFRYPSGVVASEDGAVYVADTGNHRICRVAGGQVTTLAGGGEGLLDGRGRAAAFRYPAALTFHDGALWVADLGNGTIRRVTEDGMVTTPLPAPAPVREALGDLAPPEAPQAILASEDGNGYPAPAPFAVGRRSPGVSVLGGVRVFADSENHVLMAARAGELPLLLAGRRGGSQALPGSTDGPGHRASFSLPCAAVLAADGTAYVADYEGNSIRRVRLPDWLRGGETAPVRRNARWRRRQRGR